MKKHRQNLEEGFDDAFLICILEEPVVTNLFFYLFCYSLLKE